MQPFSFGALCVDSRKQRALRGEKEESDRPLDQAKDVTASLPLLMMMMPSKQTTAARGARQKKR
jgi:hypothetical protein